MSDRPDPEKDRNLNPNLKSVENTSRDSDRRTPPPADSASVQREEGRGWPVAWMVVVVVCVVIAVYLLFF